jgi:opacity protein-like surface antigen
MNGFLRFNDIRKSTAAFAALAVITLIFGAGAAMADEIGGEDVVIPPPAAPAPPPAAPAPAPPPPVEEDMFKLYLSGITGYSWAKGEAGGKNKCCFPFDSRQKNRGHDWDGTVFGGGALGIDADLGPVGMRFEVEGQAARGYDMKTKGPVTDDYKQEFETRNSPYLLSSNSWAMFGNFWLDLPVTETFDFYLGGGVGIGVHDFSLQQKSLDISKDTSHDDLNFAWQVGAGFAYDVAEWLTLDLGYRYADFGILDIYLPGPLRGEYKQHLTSHDAILAIRLNYYSF